MNTKKFINPYIEKVEENENIINNEKLAFSHKWKWNSFFNNKNPIILEIGTWLWNFFSNEVKINEDKNYIWLEIKFKRIYVSSKKSKEKWWKNFVLIKTSWQNIDKLFDENEIKTTYVLFPDPWDKKDYQKKNKLLNCEFFEKLFYITENNWIFIFKTDNNEYFDLVLDIVEKMNLWNILKMSRDYEKEIDSFDKTNLTEFESIFRGQWLKINYLELLKKSH